MGKLSVFNFITLNGFYKGPGEDISWHRHGKDENEFAAGALESGNTLIFGRTTYEMMAGYWPTPMAMENDPVVAEGMNNAQKIVFSTTLKKTGWVNTRLIKHNMVEEMTKLKQMPEWNATILGSGSIVTQLAEHNLIDEYLVMVDPVAIGNGTPLFNNIRQKMDLKLTDSKIFKSGVVLLCYQPTKNDHAAVV